MTEWIDPSGTVKETLIDMLSRLSYCIGHHANMVCEFVYKISMKLGIMVLSIKRN